MSSLSWLDTLFAAIETWLPCPTGRVKVKSVFEGTSSQKTIFLQTPGSKSYSNRALILAALSKRPVKLIGLGVCDDTYWVLKSLCDLGFQVDCLGLNESCVDVQIFPLTKPQEIKTIYIGKAGTAARFLPALLLNHPYLTQTVVTAHPQLQKRPQVPLLNALKKLGANISMDAQSGCMSYSHSTLRGQTSISGADSGQFLSGLLMAGCTASEPISIHRTDGLVQPDYVTMTIALLKEFGANLVSDKKLIDFSSIPTTQFGTLQHNVEPDASTACYFIAAAALLDRPVRIENIGSKSLQPDIGLCEVLKQFGFDIEILSHCIHVAFRKKHDSISKTFCFDFSSMSDQAITVAVLAVLRGVDVTITGVGHIRFHESDRIAGLVGNLSKLGVDARATDDGFIVYGTRLLKSLQGEWQCHGDHRFAMSGLLLALKFPGIEIVGAECVNKTAPQFFNQMEKWDFVKYSR